MSKTALVTGGAGFIGSHVVDWLIGEEWSVRVLDNYSTGRLENLKQHGETPRLQIIDGDITNVEQVDRAVDGVDTVFHMAAHADIRASLKDRRVDLEQNLIGTINLLEQMARHSVGELVFASSSAIYGEADLMPTPESFGSAQTSFYGASKIACEAYAEAYTQVSPLKFWAFRFANVIGERCRRGVVWDFVHKLTKNPNELQILGDGKQSKEYLHVEDCVAGIMLGYEKGTASVNTFNLGTDRQTLVDEVANLVIDEMRLSNVRRLYTGGPRGWVGDNPMVQLSLEKIKSLGWRQTISEEEGLRRTARWTLKNRKRAN